MQRPAATAATAVGSSLLAACWRGVARAANGTAAAAAGAAAAAPTRLTAGSSAAALQWGPASLQSSQQRLWHHLQQQQQRQQQHQQQQHQQQQQPSSRSSSSLWQHQHQHQHQQQQQHAVVQPLPLCARQHSLPLLLQHQHAQHQHAQRQHSPQHAQRRGFVLMPRRVKYRKAHKSMGFNETIVPNTRQLAFGLYGIRSLEHARVPARTLEAIRRTLRRTVKKTTMMWIRVTPNVPVTSKPAEVRMGKGKGALDYWAAPIRPGQILFEFDRCSRGTAMEAVAAIQAKMPVKVGFVEWN